MHVKELAKIASRANGQLEESILEEVTLFNDCERVGNVLFNDVKDPIRGPNFNFLLYLL